MNDERREQIIRAFLNYTFRDIRWRYSELTIEEKKLVTPAEFAELADRYSDSE